LKDLQLLIKLKRFGQAIGAAVYFKYRQEKKKQLSAQKSNSNTVGFNFQTDIFLKIKPYTSKLNLYSNIQ